MTESTLLAEFSALSDSKRHTKNKQIAQAILTKINGKALRELLQQQNREEIVMAALERSGLDYEDSDPEALFTWLERYGIKVELIEAEYDYDDETPDWIPVKRKLSRYTVAPACLAARHPDGEQMIVVDADDAIGLVEEVFNQWLF